MVRKRHGTCAGSCRLFLEQAVTDKAAGLFRPDGMGLGDIGDVDAFRPKRDV